MNESKLKILVFLVYPCLSHPYIVARPMLENLYDEIKLDKLDTPIPILSENMASAS